MPDAAAGAPRAAATSATRAEADAPRAGVAGAPPVRPVGRAARVAAALELAREALRAEQPERALRALDEVGAGLAGDQAAAAALIRGTALCALGRPADGLPLLHQVAARGGPPQAEALYELARAYRDDGRPDEAQAALTPLVDGDGHDDGPPGIAAGALALYGRIELERGRRPGAARHLLDALDALDGAPEPNPALRSELLHDLSRIAVETLDLRLFARVRRALGGTGRAARGLPAFALQGLRVEGELLAGDAATAWDLAFALVRAAPAGIRSAAALAYAAAAARAAGDGFAPERLALGAAETAGQCDWAGAGGEDRRVLLAIVRACAGPDAGRAARLLAVYDGLRPPGAARDRGASERAAGPAEREEAGWAAFTRATLAGARDARPEQVRMLRGALALFVGAGNQQAELTALLALVQVEPEPAGLARADELSRLVPDSWLRRRYEVLAARANGPARLSPAERRVMAAICEGRSTGEIAARSGRSKNTIRNQTRRIFEVMEVGTRSALVAKCSALGLMEG